MAVNNRIGGLHEFNKNEEDFQMYIEVLDQYMIANSIDEKIKVSVFLSVVGVKTYKLLRSLLQPRLPSGETYGSLVETLNNHFKPKTITIAERFKFHKRNQEQDESISNYIVELRSLAATCDFGTFLDEALRDRLVCGLKCESMQKRLLSKKDLTFSDACDVALAMELAEKNTTDIKLPQLMPTTSVNLVNKQDKPSYDKGSNEAQYKKKCYRCGRSHFATQCKFQNATCYKCGKVGHLASVCKISKTEKQYTARLVENKESDSDETFSMYTIQQKKKKQPDYMMPVRIKNKNLEMILDTAADVSTINMLWFKNNLHGWTLDKTNIKLQGYSEERIHVAGQICVPITYKGQTKDIDVVVVMGDLPCLFGKDCIAAFQLNVNKMLAVKDITPEEKDTKIMTDIHSKTIDSLIQEFSNLFKTSKNPIKQFKAKLRVKGNPSPVFCKARLVPYALRTPVEEEIKLAHQQGIWKFVESSEWATPLVIVPKQENQVRLCGDFKITLNPFLEVDQYPLPTQQDLFSTINGGVYFSKLDMKHAYQQIELDQSSQVYLTLNTHMGLVRPTRLLYGITCAASVFQSIMDKILQGLQNVICYQDDILVTGKSQEDHIKMLGLVFQHLTRFGVSLNLKKCKFMQTKVTYLGHQIDCEGIHPTSEKVTAIKNIESPQNVTQLRSFLGLLNYYVKFIKDASTLLHPLNRLLRKDQIWDWNEECEETFTKCKNLLTSDAILVHYDQNKPIKLQCDASPYGLGVVLSHQMKSEADKPIAYASRTLTKAEENYSQLEKEALAIVFGLKKFQQYIYGKKFTIITDHRPLITLFGPKTAIPTMAAARIQRWSLLLSSFKYQIEYKKGNEHTNADALSRLPINTAFKIEGDIFKLSFLEELPVSAKDIANATRLDRSLGKVANYIKYGWPSDYDKEFQPFHIHRELSIDRDVVLWGMRVVIPQKYRDHMLELLHDAHPGVVRMKAVARGHLWWPSLDKEIENLSNNCVTCVQHRHMPPTTPLQSWIWPRSPWERIHIDYGQKGKAFFLIVIDAHSKWIEVVKMKNITSIKTIQKLREMFSRYGIPKELVSDNGPQLISGEFKAFLKNNGIRHTLVPTYHPKSNGAAERAVQHFKTALEKMQDDKCDNTTLEHKISRFLLMQHATPHATTGKTPAELFLKRNIRTLLTQIHVDTSVEVESNQLRQKENHDRSHSSRRTFMTEQPIYFKQDKHHERWKEGRIIKKEGANTWIIECEQNKFLAHTDQLRHCARDVREHEIHQEDDHNIIASEDKNKPPDKERCTSSQQEPDSKEGEELVENDDIPPTRDITQKRYPVRNRKAPVRFDI